MLSTRFSPENEQRKGMALSKILDLYWIHIEKYRTKNRGKKTVQSFGFMYEKDSRKDIENHIEHTPDKGLKQVENEADYILDWCREDSTEKILKGY